MQRYALAGLPVAGSFDAIKSIEFHKSNVLTSDSFRVKSHLQKLFDWLIDAVNQRGNPNA